MARFPSLRGNRRWALLMLAALLAIAAPSGAAAQDRRISEVHALGAADPMAVYNLVLSLLSPKGRAVLDEGHHTLIVLDDPEVQEKVRRLLASLQESPLYNVRIETRITDRTSGSEAQVDASGQLTIGYPDRSGGAAILFNVDDRKSRKEMSATQFVVVASGSEASIAVGREIPYQHWLFAYGRELGLIKKDVEWKEVGSRLSVAPTVIDGGKKIRLRVVPELDYREGKGRGAIGFTGAATELFVADGEEVLIGGGGENEEFARHFLVGYDRQRRVRQVNIFLRATVFKDGVSP